MPLLRQNRRRAAARFIPPVHLPVAAQKCRYFRLGFSCLHPKLPQALIVHTTLLPLLQSLLALMLINTLLHFVEILVNIQLTLSLYPLPKDLHYKRI